MMSEAPPHVVTVDESVAIVHQRVLYAFLALLTPLSQVDASEPVPVTEHRDLTYAEVAGQELKLNLFVPAAENSPPLLIWIHGGGWRNGSREKVSLRPLTDHGFAVASIDYRLTDTAIFPAQIYDCKAAVRWLRANADRLGYDASRIAAAGSSAGGHLALLLGVSGNVDQLEGTVGEHLDQSSAVQAIIDYYGPSDFVLRGETHPDRAYTTKSGSFALLGGVQNGKVEREMEAFASPVHYITADDPPLLILHGDRDEVVLPDQSKTLLAQYRKARLDAELIWLKDAGHGGKRFYRDEHFESALRFVKTHLLPR